MQVLERPLEAGSSSAPDAPEAIFPEARRRGRRRRALSALAAIGITGAVVAAAFIGLRNGPGLPGRPGPRLVPGSRSGSDRAPAVVVAWGDYAGVLHLGDLATRRQTRIVTGLSGGAFRWSRGRGPRASPLGRREGQGQKCRGRDWQGERRRSRDRRDGQPGWRSTLCGPGDPRLLGAGRPHHARDPPLGTAIGLDSKPVGGAPRRRRAGVDAHGDTRSVLGIWRPGGKVWSLGAADAQSLGVYTSRDGRYSLLASVPRCANHQRRVRVGLPARHHQHRHPAGP